MEAEPLPHHRSFRQAEADAPKRSSRRGQAAPLQIGLSLLFLFNLLSNAFTPSQRQAVWAWLQLHLSKQEAGTQGTVINSLQKAQYAQTGLKIDRDQGGSRPHGGTFVDLACEPVVWPPPSLPSPNLFKPRKKKPVLRHECPLLVMACTTHQDSLSMWRPPGHSLGLPGGVRGLTES